MATTVISDTDCVLLNFKIKIPRMVTTFGIPTILVEGPRFYKLPRVS